MSKFPLIIGITVLVAALGVFAWVTDAPSYMGHEPSTCNNCHVMDAAYENWYHSGHEHVAECTDCHLPHQNLAVYYLYKGYSGMKDVASFTTGSYPDAIRAEPLTDSIVQDNCIRCHEETVNDIVAGAMPFDRKCWDCHRTAMHGERGISLSPYQDSAIYQK
jgi:cytochrome c nitrite reductase small subunit